jgi:potassium-transporting ATPase potassium-binding subunit
MLIFAIIGVFIAGLMIGRTPEYLGKKIESFEMKMSSIAILVMPFIALLGAAIAVSTTAGQAGVANPELQSLQATFVPFSAHTRMSGVNVGAREIRKGAQDAIQKQIEAPGHQDRDDHG